MARVLRRSMSPQIHEDSNSGSGMGGVFMMHNGGPAALYAVAPSSARMQTQQEGSGNGSELTTGVAALGGGIGLISSGPLPARVPSIDGLFALGNYKSMIFPLSWLRSGGGRLGTMDRPKSKGILYRRPMMHLLVCFVLGLLMGFTPISWSDFSISGREDPRHELALELSGFATNLKSEGSQAVSRGEKLVELDSQRGAGGSGEGRELTSGFNLGVESEDGLGNSKFENGDSSFVEMAPGLNYTLDPERKLLIVVTPTFTRAFQAHYLTRLAHTLRLVPPPLLWLVVEMPNQSVETAMILRQTGIMYRHLVWRSNYTNIKDRGVHQRNEALAHIERHQLDGIVYFADDDNVYSLELFEQLRKIKRFGTWPVGMLAESKAKTIVEGPVCDGNNVIGWHTNEKSKRLRRFHVDMSGFGFNSTILWDTKNWRHRSEEPIRQLDTVKEGFQETTFIEQLVEDESQMEGLPSGCLKIMVWHLHIETPELAYPYAWNLTQPLYPNIPLRT